jgi:D-alanyl-lipoteichoic acid acyltransferase DltB (MBOAT superfamily)
MLFNSFIFLYAFLPVALVGYYGLAHVYGPFPAKIWLCVCSFVFYGWWNPAFVLLLVGSIAFNFTLSLYLKDDDQAPSTHQNRLLALGIAANVGLLFHYKYLFPLLDFFHRIGWSHVDFGSVVLPIGISFFTFTQIGYLVDCRQGLVRDRGLLNYVLFVTFFPHLVAGPILHHREIMPQFAENSTYRLRAENLAVGLTLFAIGLVKKVMIADTIAPWAEAGFASPLGVNLVHSWSIALAYSLQLYFDFSGYSDMAIGLGSMFGIKMPLNFNSPYKSLSIIDFWQRWHMTLTRYLTLLLYNPIALWVTRYRQRAGMIMNREAAKTPLGFASMIGFPTFTTMLLAGIWHGAGFQFIIYGALQGLYLTGNHLWRLFHKPLNPNAPLSAAKIYSVLWRVVLTYLGVLLAQIAFRANSVADGLALVAGMIGMNGVAAPLTIPLGNLGHFGALWQWLLSHHVIVVGLRSTYDAATLPLLKNWMLIFALGLIAFATPNAYQILGKWSPALNKVKATHWSILLWQPNWLTALGTGTLMFIATLYLGQTARFLYFQF